MVAGLNRRVTAFMDVQGAENMVKVWEKKHEEDIQALCYYHPNVLVTASYDGDILIWSTETNQTACRLNFTENTKPMMGHDRPTRTESQRTLIAKRFNLAITRAVNPDGQCDKSKLRSAYNKHFNLYINKPFYDYTHSACYDKYSGKLVTLLNGTKHEVPAILGLICTFIKWLWAGD